MSVWLWIMLLVAVVKLTVAALMLWLPFRYDEAMRVPPASDSSDEDGGSKTHPAGPSGPRPRWPRSGGPDWGGPRSPWRRARRRGPHRALPTGAPRRIRTRLPSRRRVRTSA